MLPETLKQHLDQGNPVIVVVLTGALPYREDDNPHTLVVVGYDEKFVYLNDAKLQVAPVSVPWENFLTAWEDFGNFAAVIEREEPESQTQAASQQTDFIQSSMLRSAQGAHLTLLYQYHPSPVT